MIKSAVNVIRNLFPDLIKIVTKVSILLTNIRQYDWSGKQHESSFVACIVCLPAS